MTTTSFPPLRAAVLQGLAALKDDFRVNPKIFEDCPYDAETVEVLKKLLAPIEITKEVIREVKVKPGRGRPTKDIALSDEDQDLVKTELKKLMTELNAMGTGADEKLETAQRIQITKTKANLIEQLLKQQERAFNVKRLSEFQSVVISILDDLVSEADRDIFMSRLEPYRD